MPHPSQLVLLFSTLPALHPHLIAIPCQIMSEFLLVLETSAVTFAVAGTVKEGATILVSASHTSRRS